MAEITLRSYSQEVDGLIELEQLDEAIAHCRQILQAFPKHLDTYRALGKAYLEAKRYGDASDIFQRVLSSEPADFVSHIGMSVIREDEGNLDSAIWHMERAFENNPANQVIQQELKRLFGQRDGSEPTKVRLTRGALARMYANGELYPQAVAELRAALDEDPERSDLQTLLAEMYWQMNQPLEAAEICSQILEKLPHCREANRIMAAVLQSSGKSDAAGVYLRRLAAIDPYTAFLESPTDDLALVDADSVTLEKLSWHAAVDLTEFVESKPDWATSLGSDLPDDEEAAEDSIEWSELVASLPTEEEGPIDPPETKALAPSAGEDSTIPEWLREGGWDEATGEASEERVSFSDDELAMLEAGVPPGGDLARANIPEWLKDIAPADITDPGAPTPAEAAPEPSDPEPEPRETSLPDWLQGIAEDVRREEETAPTPPFEDVEPKDVEPEEDITIAEEPAEPPEPAEEERRQLPTWLEDSEPGGAETILTWLGSRTQSEPSEDRVRDELSTEPQPGDADTTSWLRGVAEAAAREQARKDEPSSVPPESDVGEKQFDPTKAVTRELSPEILEEFDQPPEDEDTRTEETPESARWEPEFDGVDTAKPTPRSPSPSDETISGTLAGKGIEWLDTLAGLRPPELPQDEPEVPTWLRELASDTDELQAAETLVVRDGRKKEEPDLPPADAMTEPEIAEPLPEPEPAAPEPAAPEAMVAEPTVPEPAAPEPAAPEPAAPEPGAPDVSTFAGPPEYVPPFVNGQQESEVSEDIPLAKPVGDAEVPAASQEIPAARPSSTQKLSGAEAAVRLEIARKALVIGDFQSAADEYQSLIRAKSQLSEIIEDLQNALQQYPSTPILWQVLGDAHMKADRLADAMDAYRQGLDTI